MKYPMIINKEEIHSLVHVCLVLGKHVFMRAYSKTLDRDVYLVLNEADKQLVTENDLPIYTASKFHQTAEKAN